MMSYEQQQLQTIYRWQQQKPTVAANLLGFAVTPAAKLVGSIIPDSALQAALEMACSAGEKLANPDAILKQAHIDHIGQLFHVDLRVCDQLANTTHDYAIAMAAAEGGVTGATGLVGVALDIPTLTTLALRTIYQTALCYGFELKGEEGRAVALRVFSLASANSFKEKEAALVSLVAIKQMLHQQTWAQIQQAAFSSMGKEALVIALKDLAGQLGINLTKRKALNIVPIVGAAIGAAINASFLKDVGWAARHTFQEMWLLQHGHQPLAISYQPS
ncbi:EcsC family protein [Agitococcus lubricus]|uniref:EcsC family protein n=1 Tax=Agitococcus lubricus TaxID=1077255 RepID=A0A2T5J0M4_9GAMM|nr:EcsC family protein [Agitococcus lubricus]PTQ89892.1 EcsC family protein [Agitococcus lubricus]